MKFITTNLWISERTCLSAPTMSTQRHQQSWKWLQYSIFYIISGAVDCIDDIEETCRSASQAEFHTSSLSPDYHFFIEEHPVIYGYFYICQGFATENRPEGHNDRGAEGRDGRAITGHNQRHWVHHQKLWGTVRFLLWLISLHTRSVWEAICDALPHSSRQNGKNLLSAPTQVFEECDLESSPPPESKFGQDLALWIWVDLEYPSTPPPPGLMWELVRGY